MEGLLSLAAFAVAASLTYKAPLWAAGLIGEREALLALWRGLPPNDTASMILFVTAYIAGGTALWILPGWYLSLVVQPARGAAARRRTGNIALALMFPLLPFLPWLLRRYSIWRAQLSERQDLKRQYRDFTDSYPSFHHFVRHLLWLQAVNMADPTGPTRQAFTKSDDAHKDAIALLGLEAGHTRADLDARHRALITRIHPDQAGPNDIASRLNAAKDFIKQRRSWK